MINYLKIFESKKARFFLLVAMALIASVLVTVAFTLGRPAGSTVRQKINEMYSGYRRFFPGVKEISARDFVALRANKKVVLVDVRTDAERDVSMIPGAISQSEFDAHREIFRNETIVVYCTIGYRSGLMAKELTVQGFDAYNLVGGVLAWAEAGQIFIGEHGSTRDVHVYGEKWNVLPPGYRAVW